MALLELKSLKKKVKISQFLGIEAKDPERTFLPRQAPCVHNVLTRDKHLRDILLRSAYLRMRVTVIVL